MKRFLFLLLICSVFSLKGQNCFDAYDLLFNDATKNLTFQEFHKLELEFTQNLKGCKAPNFEVITTQGNELFLHSLQGKVVVLNFWFTNCLPCLKEIPELNKLVHQFSDDEVVFIGFARDTKEELSHFFNRFGDYEFQIVPESYALATTYKVVAWPQTIVIDTQGIVFCVWAGTDQEPEPMVRAIKSAIEQCLVSGN